MNKGEITIATFADFSKAFDTIGYAVLIQKLYSINLSKCFRYGLVDHKSMFRLTIKDQKTLVISEYRKVPYSDLFYLICTFQM